MIKKLVLTTLVLTFSSLITAVQPVTLPGLDNPHQIEVDSDFFYIVDGTTVYIYSIVDFSQKKRFGREGEGPREFKRRARLNVQANHLLVNSVTRISFFTKKGEFIKEMNAKFNSLGDFFPLEKHYVNTSFIQEGKRLYYTLNLYDENLKKVKSICQLTRNEQQSGMKINALDWGFPKFCTYKDLVICEELDKELYAFDKTGKKLFTLIPKVEKLPVSKEYKRRFFNYLETRYKQEYERVKSRLQFPPYFPGIELSPVELYPFTIRNGNLYRLRDNEETEEWEFFISKIE
jgi:hypothetical protein